MYQIQINLNPDFYFLNFTVGLLTTNKNFVKIVFIEN